MAGHVGPTGVEEQGRYGRGSPGNLGDLVVSMPLKAGGEPGEQPLAARAKRPEHGRSERMDAGAKWYRRAKATKRGERDSEKS